MPVSGTPFELLNEERRDTLPTLVGSDPFCNVNSLWETYFYGVHFDADRSRVGLLFDESYRDMPIGANVGLMVCRGIFELGWRRDDDWLLPVPYAWIVLANGFIEPEQLPRVELPPPPPLTEWQTEMMAKVPSWLQAQAVVASEGVVAQSAVSQELLRPRFRYHLGLTPNAMLVITFDSASYYVGLQEVNSTPEEYDPTRGFDRPTEWFGVYEWP